MDSTARTIIVLGSTGSIGTQALEVVAEHPGSFEVVGLSAGGSNIDVLADQVLAVRPRVVALAQATRTQDLQLALYARAKQLGWATGQVQLPRIIAGPDAATELAGMATDLDADVVLNGITGSAGLLPTLAALATGRTLALANKESLVIGGRLVTSAAAPGQIVPVDSEHSALAQALRSGRGDEVQRLILTASGGPFRGRSRADLEQVTADQAMAHPTWNMGRVVTINSSTMVNKGLELLEAALLFDIDLDKIQVVVHPQSVVHSMVEFVDGSTIAQCSPPDMKLPIALGLTWPDRLPGSVRPVDWTQAQDWRFEPLDDQVFGAVELARRAGVAAGTAPAVFNAANEVCVDAFCAGTIGFLDIVETIQAVLEEHLALEPQAGGHVVDADLDVDAVLGADAWARARTGEVLSGSHPA